MKSLNKKDYFFALNDNEQSSYLQQFTDKDVWRLLVLYLSSIAEGYQKFCKDEKLDVKPFEEILNKLWQSQSLSLEDGVIESINTIINNFTSSSDDAVSDYYMNALTVVVLLGAVLKFSRNETSSSLTLRKCITECQNLSDFNLQEGRAAVVVTGENKEEVRSSDAASVEMQNEFERQDRINKYVIEHSENWIIDDAKEFIRQNQLIYPV